MAGGKIIGGKYGPDSPSKTDILEYNVAGVVFAGSSKL
jgi:hypothetical protein